MEVLHSLCLIFVLFSIGQAIHLPTGRPSYEIDNLQHWTTGNLDLARSESVEEGKELILACTPPVAAEDLCRWETPFGEVWYVDRANGQVLDNTEEPVEGVEVWGRGMTCGILVNGSKVDAGLMGDWSCMLNLGNLTVEGRLSTEDVVTTNLRLPDIAVPVNYQLWLMPDLRDNQEDINRSSANMSIQFKGGVQLTVRFTKYSPYLIVHTDGLTINNICVESVEDPTSVFVVNKIGLDFQRTFAQIYLDSQMFNKGQTYVISIDYEADIVRPEERSHFGFYRLKCPYESQKDCWYTHFESTYARNAFPCLDEPSMKATFNVHVRRKGDWTALSNMPLEKTEPEDGEEGWLWDTFSYSVIMPTYLAAVTVTDMAPLNSPVHNTTIWASKTDIDLGRADYAKDIAPRIISLYEQYFNVKYSLPKMDLVSEEDKFTAEENWGLITFDPTMLLLDPNNTDPEVKWEVTRVIAHEIAHQWFGNLVTFEWWSQVWLNEGFASFVSYIGCAEVYPEGNGWGRLVVDEAQHIMSNDGDITTNWALSDEVTDRRDIGRKFRDPLFSYKKGATIIRMMESILTRSTFNKGLTSYLKDLSYGNAVEEDLFMHLEAIAMEDGMWPQNIDKSFSEVMKTWTNQAGLPLVTAERSCMNGTCSLNISQSQYITKGDAGQEEMYWNIPLTVTPVGGPNSNWNVTIPSAWLTTEMPSIAGGLNIAEDTPFVLNIQNVGYYRVNYDEENWKQIANTLMTDRNLIHPFNRAQIICDVLHLATTGHITEYTKQLVLNYVDKEDDPTALSAYQKCQDWASN